MSIASIKTFLNGINSGRTQAQKMNIYKFIKRNPKCTIADIEFKSIGLKNSSITARISDLLDLGVIKVEGNFESKESCYSTFVIVTDEEEQINLFKERKQSKKTKAIMQLLNNHRSVLSDETIYQLEL